MTDVRTPLLTLALAAALLAGCASPPPVRESAAAREEARATLHRETQSTLKHGAVVIAETDAMLAGLYRAKFVRADATAEDFDRDKWACDRDLGMLGGPQTRSRSAAQLTYIQAGLYDNDLTRCLGAAGGARREPADDAPTVLCCCPGALRPAHPHHVGGCGVHLGDVVQTGRTRSLRLDAARDL